MYSQPQVYLEKSLKGKDLDAFVLYFSQCIAPPPLQRQWNKIMGDAEWGRGGGGGEVGGPEEFEESACQFIARFLRQTVF